MLIKWHLKALKLWKIVHLVSFDILHVFWGKPTVRNINQMLTIVAEKTKIIDFLISLITLIDSSVSESSQACLLDIADIVKIVVNIVRWVLAKPYGSKVASDKKIRSCWSTKNCKITACNFRKIKLPISRSVKVQNCQISNMAKQSNLPSAGTVSGSL